MSLRAAAWAAVLLVACKPSPKPGAAAGDAATDAAGSPSVAAVDAGPPKERDRTLVPVGEGTSDVKMYATFDQRVVVVSGSIPYEGKANGALEQLAPTAALAPLFPDDDTFVGFLNPSLGVIWVRGELGAPGPLFLDGVADKRKAIAVREGKLTAATTIEHRHVVRWRGKLLGTNADANMNQIVWLADTSEAAPVAPSKMSVVTALGVDRTAAKGGALVVLGMASYETPRAAIYPPTWKPGDAPVIVDGPKQTGCSVVPSFDTSVVVACIGSGSKFYRVSVAGFERVFPDAPDDVSAASVGKDGALYVTFPKRIAVERCPAPRGACTAVPVTPDLGTIETAHYEPVISDVVERVGDNDVGSRSWTTLRVETAAEKQPMAGGQSILARAEDDVWLVVRNAARGYLLHSTDDPSRTRMRLPSQLDGRVMVKNTSPPQAWTGHCEQVFVRLGTKDGDRFKARAAEIEKALGSSPESYEHAFQWWLVEGRLHESPVVGVVVARRDAEERLDKMERAVEKLIAAFTENPMNKPPAYCTLPVLERRLFPPAP